MASKRFLMVPVDSSAARMPLPGATRARATLLRSARFIGASSTALGFGESNVLASQNRRFSGNSQENRRAPGRLAITRLSGRARPWFFFNDTAPAEIYSFSLHAGLLL